MDSKGAANNERKLSVARAVFQRINLSSLTSGIDWNEIAAEAGITQGKVERNARYAFTSYMKEMGIIDKNGTSPTKRKHDDTADAKGGDQNDETPSKKSKSAKVKQEVKAEAEDDTE